MNQENSLESNQRMAIIFSDCQLQLKGFNYKTFKPTAGWEKIATVDTEDEAKQKCIDILPQDDEQDA